MPALILAKVDLDIAQVPVISAIYLVMYLAIYLVEVEEAVAAVGNAKDEAPIFNTIWKCR